MQAHMQVFQVHIHVYMYTYVCLWAYTYIHMCIRGLRLGAGVSGFGAYIPKTIMMWGGVLKMGDWEDLCGMYWE